MNIIDCIRNVFQGRKNLLNQLSVFSLIGIMVIFLNNYASLEIGSFYSAYLGYPPSDKSIIGFHLIAGIVIGIFIIGYVYKFALSLFENNEVNLPEISLNAFKVFVKSLPVMIVWGFYYSFLFFLSLIFFKIGTVGFYIYNFIILFLYPLILMICLLHLSGKEKRVFSPLFLIDLLKNNLKKTIFLNLQILLFLFFAFGIILKIFLISDELAMLRSAQLGIRLFALCLMFYVLFITNLLYSQGIVNMIKEN